MRRKNKRRFAGRRNSKKILLLYSIFFGFSVILMGTLLFLKKGSPVAQLFPEQAQDRKEKSLKPEELLELYYSHIEDERYEDMYRMLDEQSKLNISSENFIARNENIYQGIEASEIQIQITGSTEDKEIGTSVAYEVKMNTLAGEISFSNQTVFQKREQGSFRYALSWDDSMIFPELKSGDKVRVSVTEAVRGSILDRNGVVLAGWGAASSVGLIPGKMNEDNSEDLIKLAELLEVSPESIEKKLAAGWVKEDSFVPVKTVSKLTDLEKLSDELSDGTLKKIERDAGLLTIPGVMITDIDVREYPLGPAASHLTGYIQKVTAEDIESHPQEGYNENSMIGRSGVESLFEKELKGQNGCAIKITDEDGETKSILASIEKQDGTDINLTIDSVLQQTIYDKFAEDKSCSVAMNPYTGEVLALVSTPTFDSNDFIFGMSEALWNSLNEDERNPLYNRFRQKLSPGSSLKPIVAAIGLKTEAIDPNEDYGNSGLKWQKDTSWGNYYVTTLHAYESAILKNALIYSDNIYFAKSALNIGQDRFQKGLEDLGFQESMPFEISLAASQYSNGEGIRSEIQLADSGYGQGEVLVNPVHLAALYSGFANQGDIIQPYLLYSEEAQPNVWLKSAYLPGHAALIEEAMEQVISSPNGTGHGAYMEQITLVGKTGTAEIKLTKEDQTGTELGWFCVFTADPDFEKPILLLSMTEDVKERGGSGYVVKKDSEILDTWFGSSQ